MKILFSPSEAKNSNISDNQPINSKSFCCENLYPKRVEVLKRYQKILDSKDIVLLKKLFGVKSDKIASELASTNIFTDSTTKAILRYSGVAYKYLKYVSLNQKHRTFLDDNLIIFSNLFGPIMAKDMIPNYKLKQGETLDGFKTEQFYKECFSDSLDKILQDELIIDLRAKFYEKFYIPNSTYITIVFMKKGKIVSHWAKAYRGLILKELSQYQPQTTSEFEEIEFENLKILEIIEKKRKREYIFEILE